MATDWRKFHERGKMREADIVKKIPGFHYCPFLTPDELKIVLVACEVSKIAFKSAKISDSHKTITGAIEKLEKAEYMFVGPKET